MKLYGKEDPFKALIMISPRLVDGEEDEFQDIKNYIKDQIQFEMIKLKQEVMPNLKKISETCSSNGNFVSETNDKVDKIHE